MKIPLILIATSLGLLFSACSSTPKTTRSYLLRSSNSMETRELSVTGTLSLRSLKVANYIDQPGLVLEQADGTIHTARHHTWAEPLRISLRQFLCSEISAKADYDVLDSNQSLKGKQLDIMITRLHGDADGNAVLSAHWTISKGTHVRTFQFAKTTPLDGTGYDALVTAQTKLLTEFAEAIANNSSK